MSTKKIVVVEDEPDIRETLRYNLEREGFEVVCAADGESGLKAVREELPDLVLLDLLMPEVDGLEVCRRLKFHDKTRAIPIIIVSAKGDETDIVLGLEMGADDYATKPFKPRELIARVRAVLRRTTASSERSEIETIERPGLEIDPLRHRIRVDGEPVEFTFTEFKLLSCLAAAPGRVFTRDHLLQRVLGDSTTVIDRTIDVHVQAIRKKLGERRGLIETIRGVGYRFAEEDA